MAQVLLDEFVQDLDLTNVQQEDILQYLSGKWKNTQLPKPETIGPLNVSNPQDYDILVFKNGAWKNVPAVNPGVRDDELTLAIIGL